MPGLFPTTDICLGPVGPDGSSGVCAGAVCLDLDPSNASDARTFINGWTSFVVGDDFVAAILG
jgi:hypothetical protein